MLKRLYSICFSCHLCCTLAFPNEEDPCDEEEDGDDADDEDSGTDHLSIDAQSCAHLQPAEPIGSGGLPAVFQTNHLVFYERFKVYQDYMLGNNHCFSHFRQKCC